jgi:hypothetical protein
VTGSTLSQAIASLTTFCKDFTLFLRISTNHHGQRQTAHPREHLVARAMPTFKPLVGKQATGGFYRVLNRVHR